MKAIRHVAFLAAFCASCAMAEVAPVIDAGTDPASNPTSMNAPSVGDNDTPQQQSVASQDDDQQQGAASNPTRNLINKIEAMEQEILQLRGQLEVQSHQLKLLSDQQKTYYKDLDARVNKAGAATTATSDTTPITPSVAKKAAGAKSGNGEAAYTAAYDLMRKKQYPAALKAMDEFVTNYPASSYCANGHYWLGELSLAQGNSAKAITEFNTVIVNYPDSNKVAPARLKLGIAYFDKGDMQLAKDQLTIVKNQFPDTTVARLAQSKLAEISRKGH